MLLMDYLEKVIIICFFILVVIGYFYDAFYGMNTDGVLIELILRVFRIARDWIGSLII